MTQNSETIFDSSSSGINLSSFFSYIWTELHNKVINVEIGIILGIIILSYMLQKIVEKYYQKHIQREQNLKWHHYIINVAISFCAPICSFVLFSLAMSISAGFTEDLSIYKFAIKLTFAWCVMIAVLHLIPDFFVKTVISCTLFPFLILSTLGYADPVINYLDSLGFYLSGVYISVFLILKSLLIITCLLWLTRLVSHRVVAFIGNQRKIDVEVRDLLQNIFQVVLYTTVSLFALDLIGIDFKSFALVGGAIGIGIGLGLQKIAANFISGLIILFEQNVKVGHLVEVTGGNSAGRIRHLGARAVVIDTGDGKELLVPNEELLTKTVVDWTYRNNQIRADLRVKVSFNSDLEKAKKIMMEATSAHPFCSKTLAPSCYLEKFTDNGAQFLLQFWVDDVDDKMNMQNDVLMTIWKKFAEEKIEHPIPYPITDAGVNLNN